MDAWCDFGLCGDKLTWELQGDMLFIDGEGYMDNYLPNGSVWEPLAWLVRSVVIGKGVWSIGAYAFSGFTDLTEVSIPKSVSTIGKGAFAGCTSLKKITVAPDNASFYQWKGMLIESDRLRIVWPPEKEGKPLSRFAVNENDCVFRIETGREGRWDCGIASFGDSDTLIEVRESAGNILDIECIYLGPTLHEPNLFLPDYRRDPELEKEVKSYCPDYGYETRMPCVVNVVRDKMEIIFREIPENICYYHADGRVEYYCDERQELVFIRVSDLTEEEYRTLCR